MRIALISLLAGLAALPIARADCFDLAATRYRVNPVVLRAIARHESRMNPRLLHRNENGSVDYGLMGINSTHLRELSQYGIGPQQLLDPCINIHVGAYLLSRKVRRYGNTWQAVGAYHSETEQYNVVYQRQIASLVLK